MSKDKLMEQWFGPQTYSDTVQTIGCRYLRVGNRVLKLEEERPPRKRYPAAVGRRPRVYNSKR